MRRMLTFFLMTAALVAGLAAAASAGDAFLKAGVVVLPSDDKGIGQRWLVSLGSDYEVAKGVRGGIEVEGAWYSVEYAASAETVHTVPVKCLANLKVKPYVGDMALVVGAGAGVQATLRWDGSFQDHYAAVIQGILGVEFKPVQAAGFGVDVEFQKSFEEGADAQVIILAGIVW